MRSSGCCRALREKIRGLGIGKDTGTAERLCGWYTRVFGREARLASGCIQHMSALLEHQGNRHALGEAAVDGIFGGIDLALKGGAEGFHVNGEFVAGAGD